MLGRWLEWRGGSKDSGVVVKGVSFIGVVSGKKKEAALRSDGSQKQVVSESIFWLCVKMIWLDRRRWWSCLDLPHAEVEPPICPL